MSELENGIWRFTNMFILFDTNVWISQLGLQSENGAAVRHFAIRQNATVVIPEIVKLEVEEKLTERLLQLKIQIEHKYNQLLPVLGKLQPIRIPSEEDIRKTVANIIPDFDVPTLELPFNVDVARSSMMKLLRKIPPSKSSEEFRDGVIWAHCLELLKKGDVYLVSDDKDFYYEKKDKTKLAPELEQEMQQFSKTHQVQIRQNLTELLRDIRMPIKLDNSEIFERIREQESEAIEELLISHGFELWDSAKGQVDYFATEEARKIYFTFKFAHPCRDHTGSGRRQGKLKLSGFGFLDSETNKTTKVQLSSISLRYPDWEPGGPGRGTIFVSANFNAPNIHHIRFPLDPPQPDYTEQ